MAQYYLILFAVALISTWWVFKKVLKIAILKNIVDNPDARKLQRTPVPVLGGMAVFFGMVVALVTTGVFRENYTLFAVMGIMTIMLYVGTMDDILSLSPKLRFIVQIIAVLLLVYSNDYSLNNFHGLWNIYQIPEWLAVPLTVVAGVGIINAINLIDGVNGLSSGYCITASAVFGMVFIIADDRDAASLAILSVGALIPFFFHNVFGKKSKMFIGDGGTLLMGAIMTSFVIGALNTDSPFAEKVDPNFGVIPFVLVVLVVPVFDCLRVMFTRILKGTSPFSPDKTHLHHLLIDLGFSHGGTTLTEILASLMAMLVWYVSYKLGASIDVQLYIVIAMGLLLTVGFYTWGRQQQKKQTAMFRLMQKIGSLTQLQYDSRSLLRKIRNVLDNNMDLD
jgi:UDP-N-acetylmuramyl pentapeptide phosphotransferase/UDP-N-acetylglucosamine-1-phosphate transferase